MLIRTKLQHPHLQSDLVRRPHLLERLDRALEHKLLLISAQAGAGKTTLLTQWLAESPHPSAWLSLDEADNELSLFVGFLCAAIETVAPETCRETRRLLRAPSTPPLRILLASFVNELDAYIEQNADPETPAVKLIMVLDDYHTITNPAIHEFVTVLIAYLPRHVLLVLTSRTDPPLPLAGLRGRREMSELRTSDLRFSTQEADALLTTSSGRQLSETTVHLFEEATEGWAVGLQLAGLSLRHTTDTAGFAAQFKESGSAMIVDYLADEVLAHQKPGVRDFLLVTSILERFNADLCAALHPDSSDAQAMLQEIKRANLFLIPLDVEGRWFRYHHLFRDLLQMALRSRSTQTEITDLHDRAANWFAKNGLVDEALRHTLDAGNLHHAVQIVAEQRHTLLNRAQWQRIERYLRRFPPDTVAQEPQLLMLKIWLQYHHGNFDTLPGALDEFETLLDNSVLSSTALQQLQGEISALHSLLAFYGADFERAMAAASFAIAHTARELWSVRLLARQFLAGAYLMLGDPTRVSATATESIYEDPPGNHPRIATTLMAACDIHLLMGDLNWVKEHAQQCLSFCDYQEAVEIEHSAHYHLGRVHYYRNELTAASEHLAIVVSHPYLSYGVAYGNAAFGLALTYLAQQRPDDARTVLADAYTFAAESGNSTILKLVQAVQADLAWRQGDMAAAERWASQFPPVPPMVPMPYFCRPLVILAKIRLTHTTPTGRRDAAALLDRLQAYCESTHQTTVLLEVLALQALRHAALKDEATALDLLEQSLMLAQPGGIIRVYVDLGAPMLLLLQKLLRRGTAPASLAAILSAFRTWTAAGRQENTGNHHPNDTELAEPLTSRELDVLALLAKRLSNQEIAAELVIAPGTVKTHTIRIYAKLNVHGRRQAVKRAAALGLINT